MELWIRSQDKTKLLKCNLIETMDFYTKKQKSENYMPKNSTSYSDIETITTYVNDKYINSKIYINNVEFATYKTKERALEVLDEIQNILKPTIITTGYECELKENIKDKTSFNLNMIPTKTEIQELSTVVYQMPED